MHGISQAQVLVFMEELTGVPLAWQYDMISGDSVGSSPAAVLNCPKEKGSSEPRYSAKQYADLLKEIVQETFEPFQERYYTDMVTLEIEIQAINKAIEVIRDWSNSKDKNANQTLSNTFNFGKKLVQNIGFKRDNNEEADLSFFNLYSGFAERVVIPRLEKKLEKAKERVKDFFFSSDIIYEALDKYMTYDDGRPVLLDDVITGFHSEAFNIDKTKPEAHTVMKPIDNWDGIISHAGLPLSEIPKRSMPAQTVFKPYYSPFSQCYYDDIATHNTMASPMNAVRRKLDHASDERLIKKRIQRKGMSIGTGMEPPKIDPKKMGELLILGRLDSSEGAPLLKIPFLFNTSKAIRDLTEELGDENAIFIEKIMDPQMVMNKYRYKEEIKQNPGFSSRQIRDNLEYEAMQMPKYNLIDASDSKIEQLEVFGQAMIWDHLGVLVEEAKKGLQHAHKKGHIDDEFLQERLDYIDEFMPLPQLEEQKNETKSFMDYLRFGGRLPGLGLFSGTEAEDAKLPYTNQETEQNGPDIH